MKVFKFGGASVKDSEAVKNVAEILRKNNAQNLFIVISAMGKTTNQLEQFCHALFENSEQAFDILEQIKLFHFNILNNLFENKNHPVYNDLHNAFVELDWMLDEEPNQSFNHTYDQVVSIGEIVSTKIVSHYLNHQGIINKWCDVRDFLRTDNTYREGKVDWETTEKLYHQQVDSFFNANNNICITQGFIGGTSENFTTTLGREGSDYTASIIAYIGNAQSVTIWKDVPGVLNADPKKFKSSILLPHISYHDAVELTYYGATVIHPKTIKPLQNKNISLFVKSFIDYQKEGTEINAIINKDHIPCIIHKDNQMLLSIAGKDFSFIVEDNLSAIFSLFAKHRVKINLMQNSAISFSVCVDDTLELKDLIADLSLHYHVLYNQNLELYTIRYYVNGEEEKLIENKTVILEQRSRHTLQLVVKLNHSN